jgi:hypothetical protein
MEKSFGLHAKRYWRAQDAGKELSAGLDRTLRPAVLLRLERVHLHRHLCGGDDVRDEHEAPAAELSTVAEIEIFRERIVLPASGVGNGGPTPNACSAVEVEEPPRAIATTVLEHEVTIEQDGLNLRE